MNCATHQERESAAFCRTCGRAMCNECKRDVRGTIFCESCLAHEISGASSLRPDEMGYRRSGPHPGLALGLGFIPGVGAIYNCQYAKAFVHVIIFGMLISIMDNGLAHGFEPLFGMLTFAFVFYMAIEAYHTAQKRLRGEIPDEWSGILSTSGGVGRSGGAIFLIVLGGIFLLNNLGYVTLSAVLKFWPLVLIGLGLSMMANRVGPGGAKPNLPPDEE